MKLFIVLTSTTLAMTAWEAWDLQNSAYVFNQNCGSDSDCSSLYVSSGDNVYGTLNDLYTAQKY